jgi:hypothetical protein
MTATRSRQSMTSITSVKQAVLATSAGLKSSSATGRATATARATARCMFKTNESVMVGGGEP